MCGHEFCRNCWCQYLTVKIMDEGMGQVRFVSFPFSSVYSQRQLLPGIYFVDTIIIIIIVINVFVKVVTDRAYWLSRTTTVEQSAARPWKAEPILRLIHTVAEDFWAVGRRRSVNSFVTVLSRNTLTFLMMLLVTAALRKVPEWIELKVAILFYRCLCWMACDSVAGW